MAELAASVIGIVGTAKTCIDLWSIIVTAKNASQDRDHFNVHLQTERIRFLLWCQITGQYDLAEQVECREPKQQSRHLRNRSLVNRQSEYGGNLLLQPDTPDFIKRHVENVMTGMCLTLRAVEGMIGSHERTTKSSSSITSKLKWNGRKIRQTFLPSTSEMKPMPLVEVAQLSPASRPVDEVSSGRGALQTLVTLKDSLLWATNGKQDMTDHMGQLKRYNDGLMEILDLLDRHRASRLQRWIETAVAAPTTADFLNLEHSLQSSREASTINDVHLATINQISHRRSKLEQVLEIEAADDLSLLLSQPAQTPDLQQRNHQYLSQDHHDTYQRLTLEIKATQIEIPRSDENHTAHPPERTLALCNSQPVVIEWRYYSSKLSREVKSILENSIHNLVSTLQNCSRIPAFHMLACQGYFFPQDRTSCYGIVYKQPITTKAAASSTGSNPLTSPRIMSTLRDRLIDDWRENIKCDLLDRLKLAAAVSRSIYQYFMVGWFHKNVRSSSILFFDKDRTNEPDKRNTRERRHLTEAYLGGFGFSRRNSRWGITEKMPSIVAESLTGDKEWLLYVHPQRRQTLATTGTIKNELDAEKKATPHDPSPLATAVQSGTLPPSRTTLPLTSAAKPTPTTTPAAGVKSSTSTPTSIPKSTPTSTTAKVSSSRTTTTSEFSHMVYDTYGLGIILLEIALWCPAIKLCSHRSSVDEFQSSIMDTFEARLAFNVGEKYADVVRWCLDVAGSTARGDRGHDHGNNDDDDDDDDDEKIDAQLFLEAFEACVVTELERMVI